MGVGVDNVGVGVDVAIKQQILSYRTPLCHMPPVTAHECSATLQQEYSL